MNMSPHFSFSSCPTHTKIKENFQVFKPKIISFPTSMAVGWYEFLVLRSGAVNVSVLECVTVSLGDWCPTMEFSTFECGTSTLFRNNGHQTATRSNIREEQRFHFTSASNSHVRTVKAEVSESSLLW